MYSGCPGCAKPLVVPLLFLIFVCYQKPKHMKTKKAIDYYGTFHGLYEWGKGWVSRKAMDMWDYWWENEFPKLGTWRWHHYLPGNDFGSCGILVSNSTSIYMHPMGFYGVLTEGGLTCGCSLPEEGYKYDYKYTFFDDLDELRTICEAVAEYCGGSFTLDTTKEFDIEIPEERFVVKEKIDYLHNCAVSIPNPYYKPKEV